MQDVVARSATAVPPGPLEQRRTVLLASLSTLMVLITFVTPLATVARTAGDLRSGGTTTPWLLSSMALGLAVALLPAGAFADDVGRRRVLVVGLVVLAVGSTVCATAGSAAVFVLGRLVEGVGGAAVLATALGLLGHTFPAGPARARATGIWGASVGGGIGLGGLLAVVADPGDTRWRATYVVVAVAALVLAGAGRRLLVESRALVPRAPDLLGAALLGAGLACVLGGLVEGGQGWGRPVVAALFAAGALLLALFTLVERRSAAPMLDPALFRRRPFLAATVGALTNGAGATALAALTPTLVQRGLGRSLLVASLVTLLFAGTSVATSLSVARLPLRLTGRALIVAGLLGVAVGQLAQTGLSPSSPVVRLVPGLVLSGIAFGVLNAALGREAVASVPADRTAMGSGANNTARYVGSALGISLVTVVLTSSGRTPSALVSGWNSAVFLTAGFSILGALLVAGLRPLPAGAR